MNRHVGIAAVALLLGFVAVTLVKLDSGAETEDVNASKPAMGEREAVVRFWRLYRQATEHRIAGRTAQAISAYEGALALNAEHEDALYYVGNMYRDAGRDSDAKDTWSRLIEVNPQSARGHSELADLHFCRYQSALFDLDLAEAEVRRALTINQEETGPLLRLGQIALVRNDLTQANAYFDQVIGSNSKSVEAHYLKGYVAWKRGRPQDAALAYRQAVQHARPTTPVAGVLGEGDTKAGATHAPRDSDCGAIPLPLTELSSFTGAETTGSMTSMYRRLDAHVTSLGQPGR